MTNGSHDPAGPDSLIPEPAEGLLSGQPPPAPGRTYLLWDNGGGTASVWRLEEAGAGAEAPAADRQQFGPFTGWAARGMAVGADGRVYLLWTGPGRAASVWSVDMEAGAARHAEYGPYDGWEARALAVGPDGALRVLWSGAGGAAALWSLPGRSFGQGAGEGGAPDSLDCGPFAGWTAQALAVGPDNRAHLLWTRGDGAASVWLVGADGRAQPTEHGPYAGWSAVGVAAGRGGGSRLLWRGAGGYASLWDVSAQEAGGEGGAREGGAREGADARAPDERPQTVHGPFAGWTPAAVARGGDGAAHLLWRRDSGGLASVWRLGASSGGDHRECGPFVGWVPVALAVGP